MTDFDKKTDISRPGLSYEDKKRLVAEMNHMRRENMRNSRMDSDISVGAGVTESKPVRRNAGESAIKRTTGSVNSSATTPQRRYATERNTSIPRSAEARRRVAEAAGREAGAEGAVRRPADANDRIRVKRVPESDVRMARAQEELARRNARRQETTGEPVRRTEAPVARPSTKRPEGAASRNSRARSVEANRKYRSSEVEALKRKKMQADLDDEASEEEIRKRFGKSREELTSKAYYGEEKKPNKVLLYVKRFFMVVGATVGIVLVWAWASLMIINKGPSPRANAIFVQSVRETSGIKFLANWFNSDEHIKEIYANNGIEKLDDTTDSSLIHIGPTATPSPAPTDSANPQATPVPTEPPIIVGNAGNATLASDGRMYENLKSDEDGIIIVGLSGSTYKGHMMIVLDPSRVIVGVCDNVNVPGALGQKLTSLLTKYDGIAGTNAGGFEDTNGTGTGSVPLGPTFSEGKLIKSGSSSDVMIGFNNDNVLMVGYMNAETAKGYGIRDAVSFGPALIINGKAASSSGVSSGLNPRTAIGQREDGAVLLLVIDGRQASSLGASYADLIYEFQKFGAVNAANLDGGSSSQMYYKGEPVNSRANLIREREMPTAIIVKNK